MAMVTTLLSVHVMAADGLKFATVGGFLSSKTMMFLSCIVTLH